MPSAVTKPQVKSTRVQPSRETRGQRLKQKSIERRERDKLELRRQILGAAVELFEVHGYEGFSLRQVAEKIGYTPTTIYLYFQDKNELLLTVLYEGFKTFGERFQAVFDAVTDPLERVRAMGRTYVQFAFDFPLHYRLMFMQRSDMLGHDAPKGYEHMIDSFELLEKAVLGVLKTGAWGERESRAVAALLWTAVHGAVSLELSKQLQREEVVRLVEWHFQLIFDGLRV
jgi:AcrR family transcriptional regulator